MRRGESGQRSVREEEIKEGCYSCYIMTEMKCDILEFYSLTPAGGQI